MTLKHKPATPLPLTAAQLRDRIQRLDYLCNTTDDTDEYCRWLSRASEARAMLCGLNEEVQS